MKIVKTFLNLSAERFAGGWLCLLLLLISSFSLRAGGINDVVRDSTDGPVMLHTDRAEFGTFAAYTSDATNRLYVTINEPGEVLHIGLGAALTQRGEAYPGGPNSQGNYQFRIVYFDRATGVSRIVHGPFVVTTENANLNFYEQARFGGYNVTGLVDDSGDLDRDLANTSDTVFLFRPEFPGEYAIEFEDVQFSFNRFQTDNRPENWKNIGLWDFAVVKDNAPIIGRLWSRGWALRTPADRTTELEEPECIFNREFNAEIYSYTNDRFVSKIDFRNSGFQGLSFNIAFNRFGPGNIDDGLDVARQSVTGENAINGEHRIFLAPPDEVAFPSGGCGEVTIGDSFRCTDSDETSYCIDVFVSIAGQVEILLDFNNNGIIDVTDRVLVADIEQNQSSTCIPWDGLKGDDTVADFRDTVRLIISYSQGVQHYAAFDVELLKRGFNVSTVRPLCDDSENELRQLFWDDRLILDENGMRIEPGTGVPIDGRVGCIDPANNCRTWDNFNVVDCSNTTDEATSGYGDKNTLNTWWFAGSQREGTMRFPVISANIMGPAAICEGNEVTLFAVDDASLDENEIYLWSGPGVAESTADSVIITQAGEYCVTISSPVSNCSNTTCRTIELIQFEVPAIPASLEICFGESIQLPEAGDENYEYLWSPATGIDDATSNQPTFNPIVTTTYNVIITGANDLGQFCTVTRQLVVNVADDIDLQVNGGGPICDSQTTITASTATDATIVLFAPDGTQIGTGTEFTVAVSGSFDYLLVATNAQNCTDSITFNVTGGPVDIVVPDSVLTCLSDGVSLSVTNLDENDNLTYLWAPASLFDPATVNSASPTFVGEPGDYNLTVTVTNQFDCEATEDVRLVVIDDNASLSFTSELACDGQTVSFTNTSTATFGYIYDFGDGTSSMEVSPTHFYATPGNYTVTLGLIYEGQTCMTPFTQEVTAFEAVLDAAFTTGDGVCDNGTASITFTDNSLNATGAALMYEWTFTGATPTTSTEANPAVVVSTSGTVTANLTVTSADECTATVDTSFTVNLAVVNLQEEVTICPGDSTELNPGADPGLIYTWSPATDFDANAANPTTSTAGTYIVRVTSTSADFNCENVDTITVVVADSINLVISGPDGPLNDGDGEFVFPTVVSCGTPIDLSVNLSVNEGVNVTYTDLDGNVLGMGGNITLTPNDRDTIVITAVNALGCIERDTIVLINNQVDAGVDVGANGLNFCAATDTTVSVINNDPRDTLSYLWEANDIINGPLDGETVGITSPAEGSVELMVTVTNQFGCDTMLTVTVTSTPFTPNQFPDVIQPCYEDDFIILGGPAVPGYTYEWEPAGDLDLTDPANPIGNFDQDGNLLVTITDPMTGCVDTQTVVVDVAPEISFMASPTDTVICEPANITVRGSSVSDGVNITWYSDVALTMALGTGNTYVIEATETGQTYTVYGEAVDPLTGCRQSVISTVRVSDITASLPIDALSTCINDRPSIFGPGGPNGNLVYEYEPAGVIDVSDPNNPVFVGDESTSVMVVVTDPATGCSVSVDINVTVTDISGVTGMADPEDIFLGESTTLTVEGCDDCTYEWFPPNGTINPNNGPVVTATPDVDGELDYIVEVTSPEGCTQEVIIRVRVEDPLCDTDHIYVPNAFTPNGDNNNDVMQVRSNFASELTEFRWIIYNRWGQEVYSSDDPLGSWDGTAEGDDLEPDVYGYWLRVRCPAGQELIQQGNITILR
jgi:gliding motility-associated-like protein